MRKELHIAKSMLKKEGEAWLYKCWQEGLTVRGILVCPSEPKKQEPYEADWDFVLAQLKTERDYEFVFGLDAK